MSKKIQQTYTTPEQSERLLKLGVPRRSADGYYIKSSIDDTWVFPRFFRNERPDFYDDVLPFWTGTRLIEMLIFALNDQNMRFCFKEDIIESLVKAFEDTHEDLDFSLLPDYESIRNKY